jgi:hypothetical protein
MAAAAAQDIYTTMRNWRWSQGEKTVARKAFEQALEEELRQTVADFKSRASQVKDASDLWKMEDWLAARRQEIDQKYDYRYSILAMTLGGLLRQGRVKESDLQGLRPDKLELIRRVSTF